MNKRLILSFGPYLLGIAAALLLGMIIGSSNKTPENVFDLILSPEIIGLMIGIVGFGYATVFSAAANATRPFSKESR